jgi:hypothetical protein
MMIIGDFMDYVFVKVIFGLVIIAVLFVGGSFIYFKVDAWLAPSKGAPDYTFNTAGKLTSQFVGKDKLQLKHLYEKDVVEVSGWIADINKKYELLIANSNQQTTGPYIISRDINKKDLARFGNIGEYITIRGVWSHAEADGTTYLKKAIIVSVGGN